MVDVGILYQPKKQGTHLKLYLSCLQELSRERAVSFLLFPLSLFDPKTNTARGWRISKGEATEQTAPVPPVLLNFALHTLPANIAKMRRLRTHPGHVVLNPINRFHQLMFLDMLRVLPDAEDWLPPYRELDAEVTHEHLVQSPWTLVLPPKTSLRRTALTIQRGVERNLLQYGTTKQYVRTQNLLRRLHVMLGTSKQLLLHLPHMVCLPQGMPLEARAYLQKDGSGAWKLAHVVTKQELFQGKETEPSGGPYRELLAAGDREIAEKGMRKIPALALRAAQHLDSYLPNLAYLTLDWLIDGGGNPLLIGVLGGDPGSILQEACGVEAWRAYLKESIAYSLFLSKKRMEGGSN